MKKTGCVYSGFCLVLGLIISLAGSGCTSGKNNQVQPDLTGPGAVMLTTAQADTTSISVSWINPLDTDLDTIEVSLSHAGAAMSLTNAGRSAIACIFVGLNPGTEYQITLTAIDASGNRSASPCLLSISTTTTGDATYHFIYTVADLNAVRGGITAYPAWDLSGNYILMADLDLNVASYNTGIGWQPIGDNTTPFTGIFNGNHHRINNLYINDSSASYSGLFGNIQGASIYDLSLLSVSVAGGGFAGGLTAYSSPSSTIRNCSSTGNVAGLGASGGLVGYAKSSSLIDSRTGGTVSGGTYNTGGLAGYADNALLTGCSATVSVAGQSRTGGLVGTAFHSSLTGCSAAGPVIGIGFTGGLVGQTISATVTDCSASGIVTSAADSTGGLVGYNESTPLTNCSASGEVVGTSSVGGLVGHNYRSSLTNCHAAGAVSGSSESVGGLIGYLDNGTVDTSYATGTVSGSIYRVGGLIGYTTNAWVRNCYARGPVSGTTIVGGLAGESHNSNFEYNYATGAVTYGGGIDGGGCVGYDVASNSYTSDYYDATTTGQSDTWKGSQPRTTAQMRLIDTSVTTYQYWDFTSIWNIDNTGAINNGYPYLKNNHP